MKVKKMEKMEKKNEIGNLPGYSELINEWSETSKQVKTGFRSKFEYIQWLMKCQGISLGRIPDDKLSFLSSNDFFEACKNQLLKPENMTFRENLFKAIMKFSYSDALRFYSTRAQEIQKNEHNYVEEEE